MEISVCSGHGKHIEHITSRRLGHEHADHGH
jgi:hypothetical protein